MKHKGITGHGGLWIRDVWKHGDSSKRPAPIYIIMGLGDGAENSHYKDRRAGQIKTHPFGQKKS